MSDQPLEQLQWHTEQRKINDLLPMEANPRQLTDDQAITLRQSLEKFGLVEIPAIDTDNTLVAGHQRMKMMQLLGHGEDTIDVRVPNRRLTSAERDEYNIRSNANTGEWDKDLLANFDSDWLKVIGFPAQELDRLLDLNIDNDEDNFTMPEKTGEQETPAAQLGDVYQLGLHRLMCGDATNPDHLKALMGEVKADMVFSDPPYNVNYEGTKDYGGEKGGKILNDAMTVEQFVEFSEQFIRRMSENMRGGAVYYLCSGYSSFPVFLYALKRNGLEFSTPIVWVKNQSSMGWGDYKHKQEMMLKAKNTKKGKAEPIMYGWKEGAHYFLESRFEADVWEIKRVAGSDMIHPTQKPIAMIIRAITNSSKRGERVLDLFGGSGSTLVACEKTERISYTMELDPHYVDTIIKRWEHLTGNTAVKL